MPRQMQQPDLAKRIVPMKNPHMPLLFAHRGDCNRYATD
jgi:hypothetical protein